VIKAFHCRERLVSDQERGGGTSSSLSSSSAHDIERALKYQKGMLSPTAEMWSEIVGRGAPPQSNISGNAQEKEEKMRKKCRQSRRIPT
jgi:hypothetical protein